MKTALFAFTAALAGTAVGFIAAAAVVLPAVHNDLALQTKQLSTKLVDSYDAMGGKGGYDQSACVAPSEAAGGQGQGAVMGASTVAPSQLPSGGAGGGQGGSQGGGQGGQGGQGGGNTFIKKMISGPEVHMASTINNTGPHSTNVITSDVTNTTTVTNNNDITVTNVNTQNAASGNSTVSNNTNAGSANTGDANNSNSTSLDLRVSNR